MLTLVGLSRSALFGTLPRSPRIPAMNAGAGTRLFALGQRRLDRLRHRKGELRRNSVPDLPGNLDAAPLEHESIVERLKACGLPMRNRPMSLGVEIASLLRLEKFSADRE